jgi:hypothetical protein
MKVTTNLHLVQMLRMSSAIPLLFIYACTVWIETTLPFTFIYHILCNAIPNFMISFNGPLDNTIILKANREFHVLPVLLFYILQKYVNRSCFHRSFIFLQGLLECQIETPYTTWRRGQYFHLT